jgi:hypothetical protein
MTKQPISASARGRVRELVASLEISSARMTAALDRVPSAVLNPWTWKGKVGAERAIAKIVAALPIRPELRTPQRAVWRFLQPTVLLPSEEEASRSGFLVMTVIASRKRLVRCETFGAAFTSHSIGRLLDRSGFQSDPIEAMMSAHAALTRLDEDDGYQVFRLQGAFLPTAGGGFLAKPTQFGPEAAPLMLARTWLNADELHDDQSGTLKAWRELLAQPVAG